MKHSVSLQSPATAFGAVNILSGDRHALALARAAGPEPCEIVYALPDGPGLALNLNAGILSVNNAALDVGGLLRAPPSAGGFATQNVLALEWQARSVKVILNSTLVAQVPVALAGQSPSLTLPAAVSPAWAALSAPEIAAPYDGAMDYVSTKEGPMGWALDRTALGHPLRIEVVCQRRLLAHAHTILPRPDLDQALNARTHCGFAVGWHRFDARSVAEIAAQAPEARLEFRIADTGAALRLVAEPLTVAEVAAQMVHPAAVDPNAALIDDYARLADSGLLDASWYRACYGYESDPLLHYMTEGEAAGHWPNFYFDPARAAAALRLESLRGALALYASAPRRVKQPSLHFHQHWYLLTHQVGEGATPLADHLLHLRYRAPNPFFDPATYRANCPAAATVTDPYRHYLDNPAQAETRASSSFDGSAYLAATQDEEAAHNPFLHFLQHLASAEGRDLPRSGAVPEISSSSVAAMPEEDGVSVVVPNHNYARYLYQRLESIFQQSWPVLEVIIIDDASDDGSIEVAHSVARHNKRDLDIVLQARRSGNVFRQWQRAAQRARGRYLWIAEADDASNPGFLANLMASLTQDEEALFAFCDSRGIDGNGCLLCEDHQAYYGSMGASPLAENQLFTGKEFLRRVLAPRNLVLNASAVVWRRACLLEAFRSLGDAAFAFTCAGDWRVYVEACRQPGRIHYSAVPLNDHRKHSASVGERLDRALHLAEVKAVHSAILQRTGASSALEAQMHCHVADLEAAWGLQTARCTELDEEQASRRTGPVPRRVTPPRRPAPP